MVHIDAQLAHVKAIKHQGLDRWSMFLRNGRWGTCCDCPTSNDNQKFPELCENTDRSDHHLTAKDLFEQYEMEVRKALKSTLPPMPPGFEEAYNKIHKAMDAAGVHQAKASYVVV